MFERGGNAEISLAGEEQAWAIPKSEGLEMPFLLVEGELPLDPD